MGFRADKMMFCFPLYLLVHRKLTAIELEMHSSRKFWRPPITGFDSIFEEKPRRIGTIRTLTDEIRTAM